MLKAPSEEALNYLKAERRRVAALGGRAVFKKRGRKHMAAIRRGKRTYIPCEVPRRGDKSKKHRFDPSTSICWGCKKARRELKAA